MSVTHASMVTMRDNGLHFVKFCEAEPGEVPQRMIRLAADGRQPTEPCPECLDYIKANFEPVQLTFSTSGVGWPD